MSEEELKQRNLKMKVCLILQKKMGCKCGTEPDQTCATLEGKGIFCTCIEEIYKVYENGCIECELYKEAHEYHEWEH